MTTLNAHQVRLQTAKEYFQKTSSALDESDWDFRPAPDMFSAAEQVAHVAHTVDWFIDGMMSETGMDTDWAAAEKQVRAIASMAAAQEWIARAFDRAIKVFGELSEAELAEPIRGAIMGGMPRAACVGGIIDHTAHHRGALAVYTRLRGKVPPMPYM